MSIQYGSLPITDIKYCDQQGALKSVSSVVRNDTTVWDSRPRTDNQGRWILSGSAYRGLFYYNSALGFFVGIGRASDLRLRFYTDPEWWDMWIVWDVNDTISDSAYGSRYETSLDFSWIGTFTWSLT